MSSASGSASAGASQGEAISHPRPSEPPKLELDPSYLQGAATMLDWLDKKVVILLRDEKVVIGILRSIDQFNNLVFQDCIERITSGMMYAEVPLGLYIIRGDNVTLVGEYDPILESHRFLHQKVTKDVVLNAQKAELEAKKLKEDRMEQAFKDRGMAYSRDNGCEDV